MNDELTANAANVIRFLCSTSFADLKEMRFDAQDQSRADRLELLCRRLASTAGDLTPERRRFAQARLQRAAAHAPGPFASALRAFANMPPFVAPSLEGVAWAAMMTIEELTALAAQGADVGLDHVVAAVERLEAAS